MILQYEATKILRQLNDDRPLCIGHSGVCLFLRTVEDANLLRVSSTIYEGHSYIPRKVRESLSFPSLFSHSLPSFFSIEEEHYRILLHHQQPMEPLEEGLLAHLLDQFALLSHQWQDHLEDQDRDDRVFIWHKR